MKMSTQSALTGFSLVATIQFIGILIYKVYGFVRWGVGFGSCTLNEIQWLKEILASIIIGLISGWIIGELVKKEEEIINLRIKFKNFGIAILFFTILFFGVIFLFVIREYYVYASEISYMFQKTFWQYCCTQIPWYEILATSLIFGVILALGFSKTKKE